MVVAILALLCRVAPVNKRAAGWNRSLVENIKAIGAHTGKCLRH